MKKIESFAIALQKRQNKKTISYRIYTGDSYGLDSIDERILKIIPDSLKEFYFMFNGLLIEEPRHLNILKPINLSLIDNRYLIFAVFNHDVMVCFDLKEKNSAGEWNIVNYDTKFLITKTWASFLANKVWAWIDRDREIWAEEVF
ncbi:MAG: hypothetical protein RLN81_02270 [Balneolaceae bacterium]